MRNRVEILRAIEFTKDDLDNIKNLNEIYSFSATEKEFMEEFKKVYELGLDQLEKFINKLHSEGSKLDVYSIQYYVRQLLSGPLGSYAKKLGQGKRYFSATTDIIGVCGNVQSSTVNSAPVPSADTPLGQTVDIYNKIPVFLQSLSTEVSRSVENVFRQGMKSTIFTDNTLPLVDKRTQSRVNTENDGLWQSQPHGTYCVKDRAFFKVLEKIKPAVASSVKNKFEAEDFRIYQDKKNFNPYNKNLNNSISKNYKIIRDINGQKVQTDLFGDVLDNFEKRKNSIDVETETNKVKYDLNTNVGQLGVKK
jgi:hypothetical protein